jgi:hypothetical protein
MKSRQTIQCWWCESGTQSYDLLFKEYAEGKEQQRTLWTEVRKETGRWKNRWKVWNVLADEICSRVALCVTCQKDLIRIARVALAEASVARRVMEMIKQFSVADMEMVIPAEKILASKRGNQMVTKKKITDELTSTGSVKVMEKVKVVDKVKRKTMDGKKVTEKEKTVDPKTRMVLEKQRTE